MIALIIKYRYFALGLSVIALISGSWVHGYFKGKASVRSEIAEKTITIMEKRNEIANNRPDDVATIKRLRSGTF